jgi:hypothetical protein
MFTDCETWRKEFKVDEIMKDFEYVEKPKVFEYYPQYYHKTDKVWVSCTTFLSPEKDLQKLIVPLQSRTAAPSTSNSSERST